MFQRIVIFIFAFVIVIREVLLHPCAFLHNYEDDRVIGNQIYNHYEDITPVFCKGEEAKLRAFIKNFIHKGDQDKFIYVIKNTYRTLMARGMKGCYVYVADKELREYIKKRIK